MRPLQTAQIFLLGFLSSIPLWSQRIVTTVAGTDALPVANGTLATSASLTATVVAFDSAGNLYLSDEFQSLVLKVGLDGRIAVVAGNGIPGYSGDGGPAINASINSPTGLAVDPAGNIYIADTVNQRIRKIDLAGNITTLAGTGELGFSGDGGPATQAKLFNPSGLLLDRAGNLFFCDYGNNRIRRVNGSGVITTVAGDGRGAFSGDNGPATQASLNTPLSIAMDSAGRLIIADFFNNRVRLVNTQGVITTIAGTGAADSTGDNGPATQAALRPGSVTLDPDGNILILDVLGNRIRRVNSGGIITTVVGDGTSGYGAENVPAASSPIAFPTSITFDTAGNLFIAEPYTTHRVRRVRQGLISTIAGNGLAAVVPDGSSALSAVLNRPMGLAVQPNGVLYIADTFSNSVRRVDSGGLISTFAGNGRFGFSGDGGPATQATFNGIFSATVDQAGNVYIADNSNNRIRRVSTSGVVTTFAGTGGGGLTGDGGPATQARLNGPWGLAIDNSGNLLIADWGNHAVRRVTPQGIISTLAGTGQAGFSGDGGPATAAALNNPRDVAVDTAGNVYIADMNNNRIRRVSPQGIITTFAGSSAGFAGDGGPASQARLNSPRALAMDPSGNILIADDRNFRVRQIDSNGTITTLAGNGTRGFNGDGGPATAASFTSVEDLGVDSAGNIYVADSANNRIRKILVAPPSFQVDSTTISLTGKSDGSTAGPLKVRLSSPVVGLQFTTQNATDDGRQWIEIASDAASMPTNLAVSANPTGLAPGSYRGRVTVRSAAGTTTIVNVNFQVDPPEPSRLAVLSQPITFGLVQGAGGATKQIVVSNSGSGILNFVPLARTTSGNWLSVAGEGIARPNSPATLTVIADPSGLPAGTYTGEIILTPSAGESRSLPVTLTIASSAAKLLVSQAGFTFRAVSGGGVPLSQNFGILNVGRGQMNWTAGASTLSGGNWLRINNGSGTVVTPNIDVSFIEVSVNPAGLSPGDYYGKVEVRAADNSPQTVSVLLNVLPAGSPLEPEVQPSGLIFTGTRGSSPGSQVVRISNPRARPLVFASSRLTFDGQPWLVHAPSNATISPDTPAQMTVQPDFKSLAAGTWQGSITVQFDDGSIRNIKVLSVVAPDVTTQAKNGVKEANGCSPSRLRVLLTGTQSSILAQLNQPVSLSVKVTDDCSDVVTNSRPGSAVNVSFSNRETGLSMVHTTDGQWTRSWQPGTQSSVPIICSITAFVALPNGRVIADQVDVSVTVGQGATVPVVTSGKVTNAASYASGVPIAPGTFVAIEGSRLADGADTVARTFPLPTELNGTSVKLGDRSLPLLYAGNRQLNAQIPFDLVENTQHQILVQRGSALSVPEDISVAAAQPGIFTINQGGTGQGAIRNAITNQVADRATPVKPGDIVAIYCTGLGKVSPEVPTGALAPLSTLSRTVNPVFVTIGGRQAEVQFSGLAPGSLGYQVNAVVPAGVSGDEVPVVLNVAGQASPPVTITVRP